MKYERKRTLSDSEARWEAVNLIAAATFDALGAGAISLRDNGWTDADRIAIERHVEDRIDGLIRRPRRVLASDDTLGVDWPCTDHSTHPPGPCKPPLAPDHRPVA